MSIEDNRETAATIIGTFEELLSAHNIVLENKERPIDEPSAASIYGSEYYTLEDTITKLLERK